MSASGFIELLRTGSGIEAMRSLPEISSEPSAQRAEPVAAHFSEGGSAQKIPIHHLLTGRASSPPGLPHIKFLVDNDAMTEMFTARSQIKSEDHESVEAAVRKATDELLSILEAHGITATFADIAQLGHAESWDDEGLRWAEVSWLIETNE
ncbi:hypothetical protein [Arthrobacter psychrochitiniphilus]|uniref:hypothetical protein n=1 Tax=Arthrobacter psychrochitiniphilus TaxID=291045 RepID=UPI003F7B496A